jgi:hypothetical protein
MFLAALVLAIIAAPVATADTTPAPCDTHFTTVYAPQLSCTDTHQSDESDVTLPTQVVFEESHTWENVYFAAFCLLMTGSVVLGIVLLFRRPAPVSQTLSS